MNTPPQAETPSLPEPSGPSGSMGTASVPAAEKIPIFRRLGWLGAALFLLAVAVYVPVWEFGFIWDDDDYVVANETLRTLDGLKRIWLEPGSVPQYYPMVHTLFWVEYQLWGLKPAGFHLVNVLLHASSAVLVFLILRGLGMPGAWLAGALFAVHPVHVESVAWITERKNVLSLFFYLCAAFLWLRFSGLIPGNGRGNAGNEGVSGAGEGRGPMGLYRGALLLHLCALLSKTVVCSFPAAMLLVAWWKRGRLARRDVLGLLPFFAIGLAFGLVTAWMERDRVGAVGRFWDHTFLERWLIAGRVVWFYAGKLLYPEPLSFIYPRWTIDAGEFWQYLFPIGAIALVAGLWLLRNRLGRGPLVAVLFFGGTLFPAMGFFNVYPMRFSYVADHFQYHASLGLIAMFAAGLAKIQRPIARAGVTTGHLISGAVVIAFALLTARQLPVYQNFETVFRDTLQKAPNCSLAMTSLAAISVERGQHEEAIALYRRALAVDELDEVAHFNLGKVLLEKGDAAGAEPHLRQSWTLAPDCAHCHYFYALAISIQGRHEESLRHYQDAIAHNPKEPFQRYNHGLTLLQLGRKAEGEKELLQAIALKPEMLQQRYFLIDHFMQEGRASEAEQVLLEGLGHHPQDPTLNGMLQGIRVYREQRLRR